jgi:hypothetical protein
MNKSLSLEELAKYKHDLQRQMEAHRKEMDSHCETLSASIHRITAPFQKVGSGIGHLTSNRLLQIGLVAGLGFLLFSKKTGGAKKVGGLLATVVVPKIRGFLVSQALNLAVKGFQLFRRRETQE